MDFISLKNSIIEKVKKRTQKYSIQVDLDEIYDLFFDVLLYETPDNDINDSRVILSGLEQRYINKNMDEFSGIISSLSIKIEPYMKKIFMHLGIDVGGEFAACLKKLFTEKNLLGATDINKFFDKDVNKNPTTPASYFKDKFLFGEELKEAYDARNLSGHKNKVWEDEEAIHIIDSITLSYLIVIYFYYEDLIDLKQSELKENDFDMKWKNAYEICKCFDKHNSYMLITDKLELNSLEMNTFSHVNWDLVFDFDIKSDEDGLYANVISNYKKNKAVVNLVNSEDEISIASNNATYWCFASGIAGISSSLIKSDSFIEWQKRYSDFLNDILFHYNRISKCNSIIVLVLSKKEEYVSYIAQLMYNVFNNRVSFALLNDKNDMFKNMISDPAVKSEVCDIPIKYLVKGLDTLEKHFWSCESNQICIPCNDNELKKKEINVRDLQNVKRFFNVIHLNVTTDISMNNTKDKSFFQGRIITWDEIDRKKFAVRRYLYDEIYDDINRFLTNRSLGGIVYLNHAPGAGGTTLGKDLVYQFSKIYPTLELISYDKKETVEEIHRVFSISNLPILIYIDDDKITENEINELSNACENKFIKSVIFVVRKSFITIRDKKNHKYYLESRIEHSEEKLFKNIFLDIVGDSQAVVEGIFNSKHSREMTPFFIGLCVYERQYITISDYVKCRLEQAIPRQKELLLYLAFFTYYGKYNYIALPSYIFKDYLCEDKEYVILEEYLESKALKELIIECDNLSWKILHPILAEEILSHELGVNAKNEIDALKLKKMSIDFIELISKGFENPSEEILDILSGLFIIRDYNNDLVDDQINNKVVKNKLSRLLIDVKFADNQIEILQFLVNCFPKQEPHFWAHLGRAYSISEKIPEAIDALNQGIAIVDESNRKDYFILYHIKGMCYRMQAYIIKDNNMNNSNCPEEKMEMFIDYFRKAAFEFSEARKYAAKREHGYVSYVQMTIQAIDFGYSIKKTKYSNVTDFLSSVDGEWYNSILAEASTIVDSYLEKVIEDKKSKKSNMLVLQAELSKYYQDGKIISLWYRLLNKPDVDKNYVRRNLVYSYLARVKFQWKQLSVKDLNNIEKYLKANLLNYPEKRDVNNWVNVARILKVNESTIISTLEKSMFYNETIDTDFYLYCYYLVGYLNKSENSKQKYLTYKNKLEEKRNFNHYIFCPEWISESEGKYVLIKAEDIGEWDRENSFFFSNEPDKINRVTGMTKRIISKSQGFIELLGMGIDVFYVPGSEQHYKTNINQNVSFYLGINFDGLRAFKVKDYERVDR